MWDNVDRIIQINDSQIDFNSKPIDSYDPQYCSKEDQYYSLQSSHLII